MKFNLRDIQNIFLYFYIFSINFQEAKIFNLESLSIPKISAIFYFLSIFPNVNYFLKIHKNNKSIFAIISFYAILIISNILNITTSSYSIFDTSMLINIIAFWIITNHFGIDKYISEKAMLSFSLGSILLSVFYLFNIGITISEDSRISLFGDNENFVGVKMSISIILILFIVLQNNLKINKLRFLLLVPIPIMFKLLIETGSRVSIISLLFMIILAIYYLKFNNYLVKIILLIFVVISIFIAFQFVLQNQLLLVRLYSSVENNDIGGREVIFLEIWNKVKYYPIFGIGQTGYSENFGSGSPHNVFLEIFSYTGIVGLFLYLYFLYTIFFISRMILIKTNKIVPFLLMIPISGLLLSGQLLTLKLGWVIFSYIVFHNQFLNNIKREYAEK